MRLYYGTTAGRPDPDPPALIEAAPEPEPVISLRVPASPSQIVTADARADLAREKGEWEDLANCLGVDPDLFFPERGSSTSDAKAVCRACVVRVDCLEFALRNGEKFGIWGGMSERERRRVRRQRSLALVSA